MRVLMVTSEWPSPERPHWVPVVVRQVDFLRRCGVDVDVFHFRGARSPARYLRAWVDVQRRVREGRYDLIHAQWGQSGLPAINRPRPLVVTYRGSDVEGIVGPDGRYQASGYLLSALSRLVARVADEVIVVSESLGRKLPRRDYHVIPSGVDPAVFHPISRAEARAAVGLAPEGRCVLFAGARDNPVKRYELAAAAVEQVQADFPVELIALSGEPHARIPLWMNACDSLLMTSHHEGSPDVVKEALACNLPVVSVDVGDVRERIEPVPGCRVCADDTPESVASDLRGVLRTPTRLDASDHFADLHEGPLTEKVISVYERALANNR